MARCCSNLIRKILNNQIEFNFENKCAKRLYLLVSFNIKLVFFSILCTIYVKEGWILSFIYNRVVHPGNTNPIVGLCTYTQSKDSISIVDNCGSKTKKDKIKFDL